MNQNEAIAAIVAWLETVYRAPRYSVRCDHATSRRQELGLYIGEKKKGSGYGSRIAEADIVVCDEANSRLELIVEVQPVPTPKAVISQILPALLADNYTPSNKCFPVYAIRDTAVVVVTEIPRTQQSQKRHQLAAVQAAIYERFRLQEHGVKAVRICFGTEENACLSAFKDAMQDISEGRAPSPPPSTHELPVVKWESVE